MVRQAQAQGSGGSGWSIRMTGPRVYSPEDQDALEEYVRNPVEPDEDDPDIVHDAYERDHLPDEYWRDPYDCDE